MSILKACSLAVLLTGLMFAQTPAIKTGPGIGASIPKFSASDQNGIRRTSDSIQGPKGALLVFFRSADW